jgi:hypothetical protein
MLTEVLITAAGVAGGITAAGAMLLAQRPSAAELAAAARARPELAPELAGDAGPLDDIAAGPARDLAGV